MYEWFVKWLPLSVPVFTLVNLIILMCNFNWARRMRRQDQMTDLEDKMTEKLDRLGDKIAGLGREVSEIKGRIDAATGSR
jgi:hypothetical protein